MPLKRSCLECRRRKIKCTRTQPCEYCTRLELRCVYPARKPRPPLEDEDQLDASSTRELLARINNLEKLLEQSFASNNNVDKSVGHNGQPVDKLEERGNAGSTSTALERRPSNSDERNTTSGPVKRRKDTTFYGTRGLWGVDGKAFFKTPTCWEPPFAQSLRNSLTTPILSSTTDFQSFLPHTESILSLWQAYIDHVDPVLKIVHAPTLQKQFQEDIAHPERMPPETAALLFACLFGAQAASPYHRASRTNFDPVRSSQMLQQLHYGLQTALAVAEYMRVPSVTTLQALTLYLACARQYLDANLAWTLAGIARQIALRLRLDKEPTPADFTPFECEMRKRLWWHICVVDIRIAERLGLEPSCHQMNLQVSYPAMVDDNQLYADMEEPPDPPNPVQYDMLYCMLRFELAVIARQVLFSSSFNEANGYPDRSVMEKIGWLHTVQRNMDDRYFAKAPTNVPMIAICRASSRMMFAKYRLALRYATSTISDSGTRNETVESALTIMRSVQRLRKVDSHLRIWWLPQEYLEWDAAAVVMREVAFGRSELQGLLEEVIEAINGFFLNWRNSATSLASRRDRWAYLVKLYHEAFEFQFQSTGPLDQQQGAAQNNRVEMQNPEYITGNVQEVTSPEMAESGQVDTPMELSWRFQDQPPQPPQPVMASEAGFNVAAAYGPDMPSGFDGFPELSESDFAAMNGTSDNLISDPRAAAALFGGAMDVANFPGVYDWDPLSELDV